MKFLNLSLRPAVACIIQALKWKPQWYYLVKFHYPKRILHLDYKVQKNLNRFEKQTGDGIHHKYATLCSEGRFNGIAVGFYFNWVAFISIRITIKTVTIKEKKKNLKVTLKLKFPYNLV